MPNYYRHAPGRVLSFAINSYMYVTVSPRFDDSVRVAYTETEIVDNFTDLRHKLIREAMRLTGVTKGVEITTIANIFAGTGLGSSSALAVGVLHALHAYRGEYRTKAQLCEEACRLEIEILGAPIGKQDQFAAGHGGINVIQFNADETVFVEPVVCERRVRELLDSRLLMFYTGMRGDNTALLGKLFGDVSQFDSGVRATCLLIGHTLDPSAAPPTSATLGSLLEPLPGSLLVRLAELLRVPVPDLTTTSHAGWGAARRTDLVVVPLVRRLRSIFKACRAFQSHSSSVGGGGGGGGGGRP
jgi:hypothetical protein